MISPRMLKLVHPTAHVLQGDCANLAQRIHRSLSIQTSEISKCYLESALRECSGRRKEAESIARNPPHYFGSYFAR